MNPTAIKPVSYALAYVCGKPIASEYLQRGQQMLARYADRLQALNLVETVSKRPRRIMLTEYACALLHIDGSCEAL